MKKPIKRPSDPVQLAKMIGDIATEKVKDNNERHTPLSDQVNPKQDPSIKTLKMLQFIGSSEGKSFEDILNFLKESGFSGKDLDEKIVRTTLWKLKETDGFIENPYSGFYKLTNSGKKYLETLKI